MHHRIKGNWVGGLPLNARHSIGKAIKADRRRCARKGIIHRQPSRRLSSADGNAITLRNCDGELARYSVTRRQRPPADAGIPGKYYGAVTGNSQRRVGRTRKSGSPEKMPWCAHQILEMEDDQRLRPAIMQERNGENPRP